MNNEELKASAENFGFDPNWIAELLAKYGSDVVACVVEAVRQGFSKEFVVEVISKLGPPVLQLLILLLNQPKMMRSAQADQTSGDLIPAIGTDINILVVLVQQYLPNLLNTYMPIIVQQYGPEITQFIVNTIVSVLENGTTVATGGSA